MKLGLVTAAALLGGCFAQVRQPPPAPPRTTKLDIDIQQALLANGLRVVLVRDPHAREVQVTMRYGVGSIDDPAGQEGVAHLVEHLMFQQKLGEQTLFAKLQTATSEFNAGTSHDATRYYERGPTSSLEAMLAVEAVRLGYRCTSITDAAFQREREVVQNERRERAGGHELREALETATYPVDHPYQHTTLGSEATLAALTREQACAFADAYYTPSNAVLVISGGLAPDIVAASLQKFLGRIPARTTSAKTHALPPVPPGKGKAFAPLEKRSLLVTWPLPADPGERMRVGLVIQDVARYFDAFVSGEVVARTIGDGRAEREGMLIVLEGKETAESVTKQLDDLLTLLPKYYDRGWYYSLGEDFSDARQSVLAQMFRGYEDGFDRDDRVAAEVMAGRDARTLMSSELQAVQKLDAAASAEIIRSQLSVATASIVDLSPAEDGDHAKTDELAAPAIHDLGQARASVNATEANTPVTGHDVPTPGTVIQRTLANGMRVVLLPLTSVPTIDARIIFDAGTGAEPSSRRGTAAVASYGLSLDLHYLADFKAFVEAGGQLEQHTSLDETMFGVEGLDMHMDYLLAALRRWVREGYYKENAINLARRELGKKTETDALVDAWERARYGAGHPYVGAGDVRWFSSAITLEDAKMFREQHFTPDHATLVIAGKFDAKLADQWIDFLFSDWQPSTQHAAAEDRAPSPEPVSLAADKASSQIELFVTLPATAGDRAKRLVAAAILDHITDDVRHQLGATYGLAAYLDEERLASTYVASGSIVAGRTGEVLKFVGEHLDELRSSPDAAAVAFVNARRAVLDKLAAAKVTAGALASSVEEDVASSRELLSEHPTALAVEKLTIAAMPDVLADLDLAHAEIVMRGPPKDVDAAFAAVGRTATRVAIAADDDNDSPFTAPPAVKDVGDQQLKMGDYEDAITSPRIQKAVSGSLLAGYGFGQVDQKSFSGYQIAAEGGIRFPFATVGLHVDFGQFSGTYQTTNGNTNVQNKIADTNIGLDAYLHGEAYDMLWGGVMLGVRFDKPKDELLLPSIEVMPLPNTWTTGFDIGLEGGVNVVSVGLNHLAVYTRVNAEAVAGNSVYAVTFGLGYHR
ncbi:MAG TPA: insulinase family protein [Kofleriaceae bacterium]|jgi:predicted Zn-dependent peptidase